MERYLIIKTKDELLRIKIESDPLFWSRQELYNETIVVKWHPIYLRYKYRKNRREILEKQVAGCNKILMRVGKVIS